MRARLELPAGVDEEHAVVRLVAPEEQDGRRDAGAVEEVGGQADDGVQQVLLDQLLADLALAAAPEEHAVGHDHAHPPMLRRSR